MAVDTIKSGASIEYALSRCGSAATASASSANPTSVPSSRSAWSQARRCRESPWRTVQHEPGAAVDRQASSRSGARPNRRDSPACQRDRSSTRKSARRSQAAQPISACWKSASGWIEIDIGAARSSCAARSRPSSYDSFSTRWALAMFTRTGARVSGLRRRDRHEVGLRRTWRRWCEAALAENPFSWRRLRLPRARGGIG